MSMVRRNNGSFHSRKMASNSNEFLRLLFKRHHNVCFTCRKWLTFATTSQADVTEVLKISSYLELLLRRRSASVSRIWMVLRSDRVLEIAF
jgi:hypothetical protein